MIFSIPNSAKAAGFMLNGLGAHSSRTIMLKELSLLLTSRPLNSLFKEYAQAILEDNVLLKQTVSTRAKSLRYLRELYALDQQIILFRALRDLWSSDHDANSMIALQCALARDSSLRATAPLILELTPGTSVNSEDFSRIVQENLKGRVQTDTLAKIGRNAGSSWTQSGHLAGRTNKVRSQAHPLPASVAYALFLGYLCGERGEGLFYTPWAKLLDAPSHTLHNQAQAAAQFGWLEYRHSGTVTDITFRHFLRTPS